MIPNPPATCVGIDLGTTYSCVAVFEDGDIRVINNADRKSITASVLFVRDNNSSEIIVGDRARITAAREPGTLVYDAKRFIGKRYVPEVVEREGRGLPFALVPAYSESRGQMESHLEIMTDGERLRFAPEHVGTLIIHMLKQEAEKYIGRTVENVVLAVPVGFSMSQINATKEAAVAARGFTPSPLTIKLTTGGASAPSQSQSRASRCASDVASPAPPCALAGTRRLQRAAVYPRADRCGDGLRAAHQFARQHGDDACAACVVRSCSRGDAHRYSCPTERTTAPGDGL